MSISDPSPPPHPGTSAPDALASSGAPVRELTGVERLHEQKNESGNQPKNKGARKGARKGGNPGGNTGNAGGHTGGNTGNAGGHTGGNTKKNPGSLAKDSGRVAGGTVVTNAANLLVVVVIARFLGEAATGIYAVAFATRALAALLCTLGMKVATVRFVSQALARDRPGEVMGAVKLGVLAPSGLGIVVAAAAVLVGPSAWTRIFPDPDVVRAIPVIALSLPFFVFMNVALAVPQGFRRMREYSRVALILEPSLRLIFTVVAILLGAGVMGTMWALVAGSAVSAVAAALALRRSLRGYRFSSGVIPWREMSSFAGVSWVANLATQGLLWVDVLILGALVSSEDVGMYQVATRIALMAAVFVVPMTTAMAPRIAHHSTLGERDRMAQILSTVTLWTSRISLPLVAVVCAAPAALLSVFGQQFDEAAVITLVLVVSVVLDLVGTPAAVALNQTGHNRANLVVNVLALALNVALNLLLIPPYGILGASIAWSVSLALASIVRVWAIRRLVTHKVPTDMRHYSALGAALVAAAAGYGAVQAVHLGWFLEAALAGIVVFAVYAGLLWFGLTASEKANVRRRLPTRHRGRHRG